MDNHTEKKLEDGNTVVPEEQQLSAEPTLEEKAQMLEQYAEQLKIREEQLSSRELELSVPESNRDIVKKLMKVDNVGVEEIRKSYPTLFEGTVRVKPAVNWEVFSKALAPKQSSADEEDERKFMERMERDGSNDNEETKRYLEIMKRGRK